MKSLLFMKKLAVVFTGTLLFLAGASAQTEFQFTVNLNGANDVPPNDRADTVSGVLTLTDNVFSYRIPIGFNPWVGGIHGPAGPGTDAPLLFAFGQSKCVAPQPPHPGGCSFIDSVTLTSAQINELLLGLWYVRLYQADQPALGIRGQILLDSDLDGITDSEDHCPGTPFGSIINSSGCTLKQLCSCDGPWRSHGEYVKCVRAATASFVNDGLISPVEARTILKQAIRSKCGRP